jgi:hypothetical protein
MGDRPARRRQLGGLRKRIRRYDPDPNANANANAGTGTSTSTSTNAGIGFRFNRIRAVIKHLIA